MNIFPNDKVNTQPRSKSRSLAWLPWIVGGLMLVTLISGRGVLAQDGGAGSRELSIENGILRVSLFPWDASLTVVDKRIGLVWRQQTRPGFRVASGTLRTAPTSLSAQVVGEDEIVGVHGFKP